MALSTPLNNRLLNMLQATNETSLLSHIQLIYLKKDEVIFKNGQILEYAYFPVSAAISMVVEPEGMIAVESADIKNEGGFGIPLLKDEYLTTRAIVQSEGCCYRVKISLLRELIDKSDEFVEILLKYLQLRTSKISQMVLCSRLHSIEQQMCCSILNILDSSIEKDIDNWQQTIATKLNISRESINFHAGKLHREGAIDMKRGKIIVLNRNLLENKVCECYQTIARLKLHFHSDIIH